MEACKENKQTKPIVDWTVCAEEGNGVRACPHQVFERCMISENEIHALSWFGKV